MQTKRLVSLILLLFLLACGHKAPPLPPEHLMAEGITEVTPIVRSEEIYFLVKVSNRYTNSKKLVKENIVER